MRFQSFHAPRASHCSFVASAADRGGGDMGAGRGRCSPARGAFICGAPPPMPFGGELVGALVLP